jgi:hypothetical protein
MMLLLDFAVTRSQPPQVVLAGAYWAPSPVTWPSLAAFVSRLECDAICERLRMLADAIRADRLEVAC